MFASAHHVKRLGDTEIAFCCTSQAEMGRKIVWWDGD